MLNFKYIYQYANADLSKTVFEILEEWGASQVTERTSVIFPQISFFFRRGNETQQRHMMQLVRELFNVQEYFCGWDIPTLIVCDGYVKGEKVKRHQIINLLREFAKSSNEHANYRVGHAFAWLYARLIGIHREIMTLLLKEWSLSQENSELNAAFIACSDLYDYSNEEVLHSELDKIVDGWSKSKESYRRKSACNVAAEHYIKYIDSDMDKAFEYLVRWTQSRDTNQYSAAAETATIIHDYVEGEERQNFVQVLDKKNLTRLLNR